MLPQKHMEATNAQNRVVDLFAAPIFLMLAVDRINVSDRINARSGLFKSPLTCKIYRALAAQKKCFSSSFGESSLYRYSQSAVDSRNKEPSEDIFMARMTSPTNG